MSVVLTEPNAAAKLQHETNLVVDTVLFLASWWREHGTVPTVPFHSLLESAERCEKLRQEVAR